MIQFILPSKRSFCERMHYICTHSYEKYNNTVTLMLIRSITKEIPAKLSNKVF